MLVEEGQKKFAFLEAKGAHLQTSRRAVGRVLAYVMPRVTYELEFDWREEVVLLLVARTIDGAAPNGYYTLTGHVVRAQLMEALDKANLLDDGLRNRLTTVANATGLAAMRNQLATFSAELEVRLGELEQRVDSVFPTLPESL